MEINARINNTNVVVASTDTNVAANDVNVQKWFRGVIPLTVDDRLGYRTEDPKLMIRLDGKDWIPAKEAWFPLSITLSQDVHNVSRSSRSRRSHYDGTKADLVANVSDIGTASYDTETVRTINDTSLKVNVSLEIKGDWKPVTGDQWRSSEFDPAIVHTETADVTQEDTIIWSSPDWHTYGAQSSATIRFNSISSKLNGHDVSVVWGTGLGINTDILWAKSAEA